MKRLAVTFLFFVISSVTVAQDDDTVSSSSIIDVLTGGDQRRALTVEEAPDVQGLSIDLKIEFEFDSSRLTKEASGQLNQLLNALTNPALESYRFRVVGHTDGKGDEKYNLALSERRAKSVVDYLSDAGVSSDRLIPEGKGESELYYPHKPLDAANRRVEIINMGEAK